MKAFMPGYVLTDSDLVFTLLEGGEPRDVDSLQARVFYLSETGIRHEMRLNDAVIRQSPDGYYWLDATISASLAPGTYELLWTFEVDGLIRTASDEFSVLVPS